MMVIILIILLILSAVVCHLMAKRRGVNPVFWGVMGGVFGPLAIPFVFFSKPKKSE